MYLDSGIQLRTSEAQSMNKIIHQLQLLFVFGLVFLCTGINCQGQQSALNKYGLRVISQQADLALSCKDAPQKNMTDLRNRIPGLVLDLRYAGTNNFMHQKLYPPTRTSYMRKIAADSLAGVQEVLNRSGLGLKIFDAYRPYSVTEAMWEPIKDDRYVADPKKGSGHNRGIAVDLTIIDLHSGIELPMGTGFDNFSDTAHQGFLGLPEATLKNRLLLKSLMELHGFKALDTEWWHFSLPNASDYELLDLDFKTLKKISRYAQ